jgi:hypothetical protein
MNIFVTSTCPIESAKVLPDRHVVKMTLETCQMISIIYSNWYYNWGALPKKDGTFYNTTKGAFRNHPCTQWAAKSYENLAWLIRHGLALGVEYNIRYGKTHACYNTLLYADVMFIDNAKQNLLIYENATDFARAMPDVLKYDTSITTPEAYRIYLKSKEWAPSNYLKIPERKPEWMN